MPDGSRFGPGSLDNLNEWVQQGRILPENTIQNGTTGQLCLARDLPGLNWQPVAVQQFNQPQSFGGINTTPYGQTPQAQPQVYRPGNYSGGGSEGDKEAFTSMLISLGSGLVCCCPLLTFWALKMAYTARAKGSMQAGSAVAFAWLASLVGLAMWLSFFMGLRWAF